MGKISNTTSYPFGVAAADDYVIGTDANSLSPDLQTKNYTLGDIAGLDPVDTLQAVLDAGNTATQTLTLIGLGTFSSLAIGGTIADSIGNLGTVGQVLKSQGAGGVLWGADSQPPLSSTKLWYGDPGNVAVETNNILNDETASGFLALNQIAGSTCFIDNLLQARVTHPIGVDNLSYGLNALNSLVAGGVNNTSVGLTSLSLVINGSNNTALGFEAGANLAGHSNTAIGAQALSQGAGSDIIQNVAVGMHALFNCAEEQNVGVGHRALQANVLGRGNTAIGTQAGLAIQGGGSNVCLGIDSGGGITGESNIIAIGENSVATNVGDDSIGIGTSALNNGGADNIAIGTSALVTPIPIFNKAIAIGFEAMNGGGGEECIAIGYQSMPNVMGDRNIAIGEDSFNIAAPNPLAQDNIAIGSDCLANAGVLVGINNIGLGFRIRHTGLGNYDNTVAIGTAATVTRNNEFILGPNIDEVNIGTGLAAQVASGAKVFADNADAVTGLLLPGDLYAVGPTGIAPALGVAAPIAIVY